MRGCLPTLAGSPSGISSAGMAAFPVNIQRFSGPGRCAFVGCFTPQASAHLCGMVDRIAGVMEPWVTQLKRRVKRNEKFGNGAQDGETIP